MENKINYWILTDTHFNHGKMKEYENDEQREEKIKENWKKMVKETDVVIHLGDFAFGGSNILQEIVKDLPGRKILVLGNHDNKPPRWYMERGFDFACYEFTWRNFVFTHKPKEHMGDKINIHGHLHTFNGHHKEEYPWYSDKHRLISMKENNYCPININSIKI